MSIPVFNIPVTPNQLQQALANQGNVLFAAGIGAAVAAGEQAIVEFAKYNVGIVQRNFVPPDSETGLSIGRSSLGTPVMGNLDISNGSYTYPASDGSDITYNYPGITIDTVLFDINQDKNIVKTYVQGLAGSIKEYIAMGDYKIKITGIIPGPNGIYPADDVSTLRKILIAPVALKVNSRYLSLLGISRLVVESFNFPQTAGSYSYQAFEMNCLSDLPIPLTINRNNA